MAKRAASPVKCPKCARTFGLPLHLARHMTATHGSQRKSKQTTVRSVGRPAKVTPGAGMGVDLLPQVQAMRASLAAQQEQLATQIAALDQFVAAIGGGQPAPQPRGRVGRAPTGRRGARRGRGAREGSLRSYVERVLRASGKPMRVAEITQAVRKAGYATSNKTLDKTVGITLAGIPGVRKVERGVYRAK